MLDFSLLCLNEIVKLYLHINTSVYLLLSLPNWLIWTSLSSLKCLQHFQLYKSFILAKLDKKVKKNVSSVLFILKR